MTRDPSEGFRSVLVPVDGSPLAEQAIACAVGIAQRSRSQVRLALVHRELPSVMAADPQAYSQIRLLSRSSESDYLRGLSVRVQEQLGHRLSSVALEGPPGPALAEYVRDSGVDLVVMTTHGRGGLRRAWLGSVADELIRTLDVPVLALRGQENAPLTEPAGIPQILVPLDGSPLAEAALDPAMRMAHLWQSPLTLLRVVHPVLLSTDSASLVPGVYDEVLTRKDCDAAQADLERKVEVLREQGLQAKALVLIGGGAAAVSILDLARPERVGLIVLATHGRGGLRRVALGSVADKLVRAAAVPVLVIRPEKDRNRETPALTPGPALQCKREHVARVGRSAVRATSETGFSPGRKI
jgi:nucleotide-binding universal stress UspA family protein